MSKVIDITSPEQLKTVVAENPLVVGDFWAEWCGPCRALSPMIEKLADDYGDQVTVVKINVDNNPELSAMFGIQSIPTVATWKGDLSDAKGFIGVKPYEAIKAFVEDRINN